MPTLLIAALLVVQHVRKVSSDTESLKWWHKPAHCYYLLAFVIQVGPMYWIAESQSLYSHYTTVPDGIYIWPTFDSYYHLHTYHGV